MDFPGILMVVSGPSAAGKGTLCRHLLEDTDNLHLSVSYTTRKPRAGEEHGRHYYFCSREEFEAKVRCSEFLEWAEVYGNFYGTPWEEMQTSLKAGSDILLEIDMQGARQVRQRYPGGIFVFILPPSKEDLQQRLLSRGTESPETVQLRLENLEKELEYVYEYDYVVINDAVDEAVDKLRAIYVAERCRPHRSLQFWKG